MKTRNQLRRRTGKLRSALLALALLASGSASAQWIVNDPAHMGAQIAEFGQQAARWGEQGRQWLAEYEQFMQQYNSFLSSIQNMQSMFGLPQGAQLQPVPEDFMVQEECGEPYGGGTAGILGRLTGFSIGDNPQQKRWEYCAGLQRMRNKQYNEMVEYLQQTMPQMSSELDSAGRQFVGSGKTAGDMSAYAAKLDKVKGDMARSNEEFNARMKAYDTYAKATEHTQGSLTKSTLRGGSGLIQQVTNAAVMREALCGGGQCD
jgi:hypothetical protein